ncbi:MAG: hypothetical protein HOK84_06040, partial [Bacteroidetes bacterium]|nr:hypothetical protein [Bacteroidota bacterium]
IKQIQGSPLETSLVDRLFILDTSLISFDHRSGDISYFASANNWPTLSKGDMIAYYSSDEAIYGRIINLLSEGELKGLELEPVHLNELFSYMAIRDTLRSLGNGYETILGTDVSLSNDTLTLQYVDIEILDGVIIIGRVRVNNLSLWEQADGEVFSYMGPKWAGGTETRSFQLEWNQNLLFDANLGFYALDGEVLQDSLLLRTRIYTSDESSDFPVHFKVEDWIVFQWYMPGTSSFDMDVELGGSADFTAEFSTSDLWQTISTYDFQTKEAELPEWNHTNTVETNVRLTSRLIPVFCGQSGPLIEKNISTSIEAKAEWPEWTISSEFDYNAKVISDAVVFKEMPVAIFQNTADTESLFYNSGVLENESPVASFYISPSTGFTSTDFKFNANASSDREDNSTSLQVRWDFDGNGTWDTEYSIDKVEYHRYVLANTYEAKLEVKDSQNSTSISTETIEVHSTSSAPIAAFTISPEFGKVADFFTFDASGCYDAEDPLSTLEVRWDFQNDGEWDTHFETSKAKTWVYDAAMDYVVKLEVRDSDALTGSTTKLLKVENANIKPTAFFTVSPETGSIETRFDFDASGSTDVEDSIDELQVRWDWKNNGIWDTEYRLLKTITHEYSRTGTYTVVIEVLDTDGFSNTFSRDVIVNDPNTPPSADFTINPTIGTINTKFVFDASISTDKEDDTSELEVKWDWDNEEPYDTEYSSVKTITYQWTQPGTYVVKMMIRDSGGLEATKARFVTVQ